MTDHKTQTPKLRIHRVLMTLLMAAMMTGCATPGIAFGETVGEKFRKALANVDAVCKARKIGPYLDTSDPEYRRKSALTNCEVLKVKPFDLNAVLATPEGKFAYSIKLPPPLDKPQVRRTDYRSAEDYFQALCERVAGDTVFHDPGQVKGISALRTPPALRRFRLGSFSEETMSSQGGGSQPELLLVQRLGFEYVERPIRPDEPNQSTFPAFRRYTIDPQKPVVFPDYALRYESIPTLTARFGVIWRGTPAFDSREEGIIGGELIVLNRESEQVIAVRRHFTIDEVDLDIKDRVRFRTRACPGKVVTDGYDLIGRALGSSTEKGK